MSKHDSQPRTDVTKPMSGDKGITGDKGTVSSSAPSFSGISPADMATFGLNAMMTAFTNRQNRRNQNAVNRENRQAQIAAMLHADASEREARQYNDFASVMARARQAGLNPISALGLDNKGNASATPSPSQSTAYMSDWSPLTNMLAQRQSENSQMALAILQSKNVDKQLKASAENALADRLEKSREFDADYGLRAQQAEQQAKEFDITTQYWYDQLNANESREFRQFAENAKQRVHELEKLKAQHRHEHQEGFSNYVRQLEIQQIEHMAQLWSNQNHGDKEDYAQYFGYVLQFLGAMSMMHAGGVRKVSPSNGLKKDLPPAPHLNFKDCIEKSKSDGRVYYQLNDDGTGYLISHGEKIDF